MPEVETTEKQGWKASIFGRLRSWFVNVGSDNVHFEKCIFVILPDGEQVDLAPLLASLKDAGET